MKKIYYVFILLGIIVASCNDEISDTYNNLDTPSYEVVDGVLCFKNSNSIEVLKDELYGKDYGELDLWEESIGFNSIEKANDQVMESIICHLESYMSLGLSEEEIIQKVKDGELEDLTLEISQRIDELKLVYKTDDDSVNYLDYSFNIPFPCRFLNEDYEVAIGDTLFRYYDEKIEIYPEFSTLGTSSNNKAMIAYRSIIQSDPLLKDVTLDSKSKKLCFDEMYVRKDHKLTANFTIERNIYQKTSCTSNCVRTKVYAYIYYQGYYWSWGKWRSGTYRVDAGVAFDVEYYNSRTGIITYLDRQEVIKSDQMSSPIIMYNSGEKINSYYSWYAIGNVDCMSVDMGSGFECVCNQNMGLYGEEAKDGYLPMSYLSSTISD